MSRLLDCKSSIRHWCSRRMISLRLGDTIDLGELSCSNQFGFIESGCKALVQIHRCETVDRCDTRSSTPKVREVFSSGCWSGWGRHSDAISIFNWKVKVFGDVPRDG